MAKLQCACFAVVILLNVYSGTCKPVVEVEDELVLDARKPVLTHVKPVESVDANEKEENKSRENERNDKEVKTDEENKETLKTEVLEKEVAKKDDKRNRPDEEDKKNEKFCGELCSSCDGSDNVFDIAEPSCFCKVTSVKSVKCLEEKVTEDIVMKVIAYVETDLKSEEEKLVAQYLKEREELSLNRNKRCCGVVGASNPVVNERRQLENARKPGLYDSNEYSELHEGKQIKSTSSPRLYERRQLRARQNNRQSNYEEDDESYEDLEGQYALDDEDLEGDVLGARKITAGAQLENLWRKALRAEDTSPERSEEEESSKVTEKPTPAKRNKLAESRRTYKYEPPANFKSLLSQKKVETSNDTVTEAESGKAPQKQRYLSVLKPLKSSLQKIDEKASETSNESMQKEPIKMSKSSRKQIETHGGPIQEEKKSLKERLTESKLQSEKQPISVPQTGESDKAKKDHYKSLDDRLYEQELKRQKFLSSIREKYYTLPRPNTKIVSVNSNEHDVEEDVIKTKNKNKKYSENNTGILGSKNSENSKYEKRKIAKANEEEKDLAEKNKTELKSIKFKDEYTDKYVKDNKKYKMIKSFEENENLKNSKASKIEKKDQIVGQKNTQGYPGKPIVSPFIDDRYEEKPYIYKYAKNNDKTPELKTSKNKEDQTHDSSPKQYIFRSKPSNKEYSEKDNELGGATKSKESISTLISKIRAKYEKNQRDVDLSERKSKSGNQKEVNVENDKIISSPSQQYKDSSSSQKRTSTKSFVSRTTKPKHENEEDNENVNESRKPSVLGQKIRPKYVLSSEDEHETQDGKMLKNQSTVQGKSVKEKPSLKYNKNAVQFDEKNSEEHPIATKYLKSKYSGVNPSLIRENKGLDSKKTFRSSYAQNSGYEEDDETTNSAESNKKDTSKTKYFERKQELLQKMALRQHEKSDSKSVLGKENIAEPRSIEIDTPQEVTNGKVFPGSTKVFPGQSREERKKILESALNKLSEKNKYIKQPISIVEYPNKDAMKPTSREEENRKFLEERVKEVLGKTRPKPYSVTDDGKVKEFPEKVPFDFKSSSLTHTDALRGKLEQYNADKLISLQDSKPAGPGSKIDVTEKDDLKRQSTKKLIEQIKASRLESSPDYSKSFVTPKIEVLKEKKTNYPEQEPTAKLSLKELIEQRKLERYNTLERSKLEKESNSNDKNSANNESPVVSSPLSGKEKDIKSIMEQNPQKHCEQCMEYINHMSQLQREQMLSQKPYSTRSISSKSNQNIDTVETEDQVAQEKFLNCQCFENKNCEKIQTNSMLGQANPVVTASNDAIVGKPFNMHDVSQTFQNIKTGIETSVNGANDKIAKGFNDLKTTLQNEYQQASHSDLAENLKDSTDKVSQKISDITHTVQDKYDSVTQKGIEGNIKDVSNTVSNVVDNVKSEFHHVTDGIVSQPTPNRYTTISPTGIPTDELKTKYAQAKYVDPNQKFQPQTTLISGNVNAPINLE